MSENTNGRNDGHILRDKSLDPLFINGQRYDPVGKGPRKRIGWQGKDAEIAALKEKLAAARAELKNLVHAIGDQMERGISCPCCGLIDDDDYQHAPNCEYKNAKAALGDGEVK